MARRSSASAAAPRPEVLAFLQDIKANPEDDTPRLVLADWLEERGDPRGEFVRLQCQNARRVLSRESVAPERREVELLEEYGAGWLGPLAAKGIEAQFRRGLVTVEGSARNLLSKPLARRRSAEELAWVDSLRIHDRGAAAVKRLALSPQWTCLVCLDLSGRIFYGDPVDEAVTGMGPKRAVALAAAQLVTCVRELNLALNYIGAEGMAALAALPNLERLRVLNLLGNMLGDQGTAALTSSRSLTGLTELHLHHNRIGEEGFAALAQWPGLSSVTDLGLVGNYLGPRGTAALAASLHLGRLRELRLGVDYQASAAEQAATQIGPEGAAALSRSASLSHLARLYLPRNGIGPVGAAALAGSRTLTGLNDLDLSENNVGDAGAIALASSPNLSRLTRLVLRENGIGDRGALALAASQYLSCLKHLNFVANRETGIDAILEMRGRFGGSLLT